MRVPSRHMRPIPKDSWLGVVVFLVALFAIVSLLVWYLHLVFAAVPLAFGVAALYGVWSDRRVRAARKGYSIGHFARSFDIRKSDTWIIRAVYEGLSDRFPVRATDRFKEDFRMEVEDFDAHVLAIAERCGRSLTENRDNPYFGHLYTVGDLVHFLHHQPMTPEAEARRVR